MTHSIRVLGLALAAALLALLAVAPSTAGTAKCSAEQGQAFIESGRYKDAIREFTCLVDAEPTAPEGYRGRAEAEVLLGRYSDGLSEYQRLVAYVIPVHPDAQSVILDGYAARLAAAPQSVTALTGASFARWAFYDYPQAIHFLEDLLAVRPNDLFGTLFRGSSRVLHGVNTKKGIEDLDRALALAPQSADVRFIVADAYTYGLGDYQRAFAEATLALDWGLDTPRVHAILATALNAFGELASAAAHIERSIDLVTTELVPTSALAAGGSFSLDLVPGRTYEIPIDATAGETISIATSSHDFWDSIAVILAPDGTPVVGSDDTNAYFAAFDWVAPTAATYRLRVTSFESVSTGTLVVTRG